MKTTGTAFTISVGEEITARKQILPHKKQLVLSISDMGEGEKTMDKLERGREKDEYLKYEYMQSSGISVEQARVFF